MSRKWPCDPLEWRADRVQSTFIVLCHAKGSSIIPRYGKENTGEHATYSLTNQTAPRRGVQPLVVYNACRVHVRCCPLARPCHKESSRGAIVHD